MTDLRWVESPQPTQVTPLAILTCPNANQLTTLFYFICSNKQFCESIPPLHLQSGFPSNTILYSCVLFFNVPTSLGPAMQVIPLPITFLCQIEQEASTHFLQCLLKNTIEINLWPTPLPLLFAMSWPLQVKSHPSHLVGMHNIRKVHKTQYAYHDFQFRYDM